MVRISADCGVRQRRGDVRGGLRVIMIFSGLDQQVEVGEHGSGARGTRNNTKEGSRSESKKESELSKRRSKENISEAR